MLCVVTLPILQVDLVKSRLCSEFKQEDEYRVAKTHRMPYLYRLFSAKEPYN